MIIACFGIRINYVSVYIRITVHCVHIGIRICFISVPNASSFLAARQAPPPAPVRDGGGSILGGIGSTIAQGRYSKLVLFRIASDINIIVILELI
jgi:prolipoprotein diacylglyceryltransferase